MAQHLFGVKNLNAYQRLAFTDVQTDFVRQAQCAAPVQIPGCQSGRATRTSEVVDKCWKGLIWFDTSFMTVLDPRCMSSFAS